MSDNVVDFTTHWLKKQEQIESQESGLDDLHDICTVVANEALNSLRDDYGLDIQSIEYSPEIIFFFEAFKGLIMKCDGQWHPFQDFAQEFFDAQGIKIVESADGGYHFVIDDEDDKEPAND